MKKIFFSCLVISVALIACTPLARPVNSIEDTASINIACRDEKGLMQTILLQLRTIKARDIKLDSDGYFLNINANFWLQETPLFKIDDIKWDLEQTPGVLSAIVDVGKIIVKQNF